MSVFAPLTPPIPERIRLERSNVLLNVLNLHAERSNSHAEHFFNVLKFTPNTITPNPTPYLTKGKCYHTL